MAYIALRGRAIQLQQTEVASEARDWVRAHDELSRLAKSRAELEWEEGRGLLAALRAGVHRYLGFASFAQYVESLFGYKPRSVEEKLRVAEALETLPLLSEDLRTGSLSWSAVRELTRVATRKTENDWRKLAHGKSVRQIEDCVSGRRPGDTPDSPADPGLRRHVLAFEVRAETLATFREALTKLRRDAGGPLDEEAALLLMARQVLGGPTDPGRASYQIAFTLCDRCGRGFQHGRGEPFEVEPEVTQMAACDAQYIGRIDSAGTGRNYTENHPTVHDGALTDDSAATPGAHVGGGNAHPGADRRIEAFVSPDAHANLLEIGLGVRRDEAQAGCPNASDDAFVSSDAHANRDEAQASRASASGNDAATDGANSGTHSLKPAFTQEQHNAKRARKRATQSIPPAARRLVVRRDGARCVVPGCAHASFLDVHHVELRSEGGKHDPESLVVLCAAHHRAIHRGALILEGSVAKGLVFRHADGSIYRSGLSPHAVAAQTQAFAALRRLGFREGDVRRALDRLRTEVGVDSGDARQVLRAALRLLTPVHGPSSIAR